MRCLLALLVACTGEAPPPVPAPAPAAPEPARSAEAELLAKGPPQTQGPYTQALVRVAKELGVGVVRCPLSGGGKVRQRFGNPRDHLDLFNPLLLLEVPAGEEPPWDPVFDEAGADDQWLSLLAVPGKDRGWFATRKRMFEYTFAPPAAGEVSYCTEVREIAARTVRGKVDLTGVTDNAFPIPCAIDPEPIAGDGTFVVDVPVPCTLWVEAGIRKSPPERIPPGTEPYDATFVLGPPDPLMDPDKTFNAEGKAVAKKHVAALRERHARTVSLVEALATTLADDPAVMRTVNAWKWELHEWNVRLDNAHTSLDRRKPKPAPERPR